MNKRLTFMWMWIFCYSEMFAQVNFDRSIVVENTKLYADLKNENVYYYPPAGIEIVTDREGNPDFKLVILRYTGRKLSQDQQKKVFQSIVQLKIRLRRPTVESLNVLKTKITGAQFKMIPLRRAHYFLVYAPISPNEKNLIRDGDVEEMPNGLADERIFTIKVSNEDAMLLEAALTKRQALISIGYAFFAEGREMSQPFANVDTGFLNQTFKGFLQNFTDSLTQKESQKISMVSVGASEVVVPAPIERFVKKIDINEQLPAEYAAIEVRCYDFDNGLRNDLYAKKIEIEATATDSHQTSTHATFYRNAPDIYYKSLRFNYAIKIDAPFRYRITEIDLTGKPLVKGWVFKNEWGNIDITSQ